MRRVLGLAVLAALILGLGACEKTGDSGQALKADAAESTSTSVTTTSTTATEPPTTTTTPPTTAAPTTTTTAKPTTTSTAKPKTTTTTAGAASQKCHPSYEGTCIPPDVSDADCAGGTGDGPWYVQEKDIRVVGPDVFRLDADHDGIGCEST